MDTTKQALFQLEHFGVNSGLTLTVDFKEETLTSGDFIYCYTGIPVYEAFENFLTCYALSWVKKST